MPEAEGKKILLGITASIAAYKAPYIIRDLIHYGHQVRVILTKSAHAFITPLTLQAISENPVSTDLLDSTAESAMSHIILARWADIVLIAPTSADFIAKIAGGFADDFLSSLCLATRVPILIAPAMNKQMWLNPATQRNVEAVKTLGHFLLGPAEGIQACGETGPGRMLEPSEIALKTTLFQENLFLKNHHVLVTAGPTHEPIDPVRYIANRSSGKMGYALAEAALAAGASVTLISGPTHLSPPHGMRVINIITAEEMRHAVEEHILQNQIFICNAAIADFTPACSSAHKIKKESASLLLPLEPTVDILHSVSRMKPRPFIAGFAAETQNMAVYAEKKFLDKNIDILIANDVSLPENGFECDENTVIVFRKKDNFSIKKTPKYLLAMQLIKIIHTEYQKTSAPLCPEEVSVWTA